MTIPIPINVIVAGNLCAKLGVGMKSVLSVILSDESGRRGDWTRSRRTPMERRILRL
jgi:hypothetical protein